MTNGRQGGGGGVPGWVFGLVGCIVVIPVVVAVVGILAAIAIPNFLKFQCKSKQSEAKVHLSGLFTAQKAFYGEYGFYTSDLIALNWAPDGTPLYLYGFAAPGPQYLEPGDTPPTDYDPERRETSHADLLAKGYYSNTKMTDLNGVPLSPIDLPFDAVVEHDRFVAAAIGDVDTDMTRQLDIWTIDESKNLRVLSNDCSQ